MKPFYVGKIASATFHPASKTLVTGQSLRLEADPKNKYDPKAIRLLSAQGQVGFVPRADTEQFHSQIALGRAWSDFDVTCLAGRDSFIVLLPRNIETTEP